VWGNASAEGWEAVLSQGSESRRYTSITVCKATTQIVLVSSVRSVWAFYDDTMKLHDTSSPITKAAQFARQLHTVALWQGPGDKIAHHKFFTIRKSFCRKMCVSKNATFWAENSIFVNLGTKLKSFAAISVGNLMSFVKLLS